MSILGWPLSLGVIFIEKLLQTLWQKTGVVYWLQDVTIATRVKNLTITSSFPVTWQTPCGHGSLLLVGLLTSSYLYYCHLGSYFFRRRCLWKTIGWCGLLPCHLYPLATSQWLRAQWQEVYLEHAKVIFVDRIRGMIISLTIVKVQIHHHPILVFLGMAIFFFFFGHHHPSLL